MAPRTDTGYYDEISSSLYTGVLADVMDTLGYRNQVMRHDIRPIYPEARVVGRAATMLAIDAFEIPPEPYKLEMALLDDLKLGEVVVCAQKDSRRSSIWGELLSTHTRAKGGRGAVFDGFTRDVWGIVEMKFPVFATGFCPADSKGRSEVVSIRSAVEVGGVLVRDGDLVFADIDGCLAIPREAEEETVRLAMEKVRGENNIRDILARGANLQEVFRKYGIL